MPTSAEQLRYAYEQIQDYIQYVADLVQQEQATYRSPLQTAYQLNYGDWESVLSAAKQGDWQRSQWHMSVLINSAQRLSLLPGVDRSQIRHLPGVRDQVHQMLQQLLDTGGIQEVVDLLKQTTGQFLHDRRPTIAPADIKKATRERVLAQNAGAGPES